MATQWNAGTSAGQVLTAAKLNTIGAAWETYTPAPYQGGFISSFVTNYSKYALFQKTCIVQQKITFTGSTGAVAGNPILLNLPFAALTILSTTGSYYYLDSGTANYVGAVVGNVISTNYVGLMLSGQALIGQTPNIIVQNNDSVQFTISYEIA
jgi:hypothetical protein